MDFANYLDPELYIIVPVLYVVGILIKKSEVKDKFIPLILGVLGIALALAYKLTAHLPVGPEEIFSLIFASFTQGVLCAASSVYVNNIYKQFKKDKNQDNGKTDVNDRNN